MGYNVLIVDDDLFIHRSVMPILRRKSCHVVLTSGEDKATKLLDIQRFDLVITESIIQHTNGFTIVETANRLNPEAIVVVLTGYANMASAVKAFRMGADDYLVKRDAHEVTTRIEYWLDYLEIKNNERFRELRVQGFNNDYVHGLERASTAIVSLLGTTTATLELIGRGSYGELSESLRRVLGELNQKMRTVLEATDEHVGLPFMVKEYTGPGHVFDVNMVKAGIPVP
jgi:DNA-binding NtrC family response regulator